MAKVLRWGFTTGVYCSYLHKINATHCVYNPVKVWDLNSKTIVFYIFLVEFQGCGLSTACSPGYTCINSPESAVGYECIRRRRQRLQKMTHLTEYLCVYGKF